MQNILKDNGSLAGKRALVALCFCPFHSWRVCDENVVWAGLAFGMKWVRCCVCLWFRMVWVTRWCVGARGCMSGTGGQRKWQLLWHDHKHVYRETSKSKAQASKHAFHGTAALIKCFYVFPFKLTDWFKQSVWSDKRHWTMKSKRVTYHFITYHHIHNWISIQFTREKKNAEKHFYQGHRVRSLCWFALSLNVENNKPAH